ncbi:MAG: hypothetical protein OEW12_10335 [Deltaproteobacteria bacterium]|nr:hypothetical protein [Deltaproteobacteria bacterium]
MTKFLLVTTVLWLAFSLTGMSATAHDGFLVNTPPDIQLVFSLVIWLNFAILAVVGGWLVRAHVRPATGGQGQATGSSGGFWSELGWVLAPAFLLGYVVLTYV